MEITRRSRLLLRLQSLIFNALFVGIIGLLAWLSTQYVYQVDWTAGGRNTISDDTRQLLGTLVDEVQIIAFAREDELLRKQIQSQIGTYQRFKPDITLEFVNPDTSPERVREQGVTVDGELVVTYQNRSENLTSLSESSITNALLRLSRKGERWIVFLSGHAEGDPHGEANFDLGLFGRELERGGLRIQQVNLAEMVIPSNTNLLVIASPRVSLLPGEVDHIKAYVEQGGNLLWLAEPGEERGLTALAEQLGIEFLPGTIVDASSQLFGVDNPSIIVVTGYPNQPITREMTAVTVFPEAAALDIRERGSWQAMPLLSTLNRSWTEIGELSGEIQYDADSDERAGPLDLGVALTRSLPADIAGESAAEETREQRVVVIGDGDFLSNTYLGNAGNLDLGLNIVNWLSHDEDYMDIRVKSAPDTSLELGRIAQGVIGLGFLIGLPLLLLTAGGVIWLRRRRR
jgi:ABC-type uncharacterized transport system involved in gliding motility auxiliary subunit